MANDYGAKLYGEILDTTRDTHLYEICIAIPVSRDVFVPPLTVEGHNHNHAHMHDFNSGTSTRLERWQL